MTRSLRLAGGIKKGSLMRRSAPSQKSNSYSLNFSSDPSTGQDDPHEKTLIHKKTTNPTERRRRLPSYNRRSAKDNIGRHHNVETNHGQTNNHGHITPSGKGIENRAGPTVLTVVADDSPKDTKHEDEPNHDEVVHDGLEQARRKL